MKFKFEFDNAQNSNDFNRFEIRRMFQMPGCRMRIRGKILVPRLISYGMHTAQTARQYKLFLKFNLSNKLQFLNVQHNFCSVTCYTVLIWTLILLTLGNNVVTLFFNWPKPVQYIPTDKTNAYICIRIRWILKVFQNLHLTNANFDQFRHISNSNATDSFKVENSAWNSAQNLRKWSTEFSFFGGHRILTTLVMSDHNGRWDASCGGGWSKTSVGLHYCRTLFFHCILISRFSYVENSLHFNFADFPVGPILARMHWSYDA